jgi:hypothetical protein
MGVVGRLGVRVVRYPLLLGDPVFPSPVLAGIVYGTVQGFLLGVGAIAGVTARRLSYEEHRS